MFVAQARARQDDGGETRVADVDGQAGGDQGGLARRQSDGRIEAGAQVQAGTAGRGIAGTLLGHAGVQDFEIDGGGGH